MIVVEGIGLPHVDGQGDGFRGVRRDDHGDREIDVDDVVAAPVAARRTAAVVDDLRAVHDLDVDVHVVLAHQPAFALLGVDAADAQAEGPRDHDRVRAAVPEEAAVLEGVEAAARDPRNVHLVGSREAEASGRPAEIAELLPDVAVHLERAGRRAPVDRGALELRELADREGAPAHVRLVSDGKSPDRRAARREVLPEDRAVHLVRVGLPALVVHARALELLLETARDRARRVEREPDRARLAERLVVEVDLTEDLHRAGCVRPVDGALREDALASARVGRGRFIGDEIAERRRAAQAAEECIDRAVQLEGRAHRVVVHERAVLIRLEVGAAAPLVRNRRERLAEVQPLAQRLELVRDEPLRMRAALVDLRLQRLRNAGEPLDRGDLAVEVVARAVDPGPDEEVVAGHRFDRAPPEGVHGHDRLVDEQGDRVDVVHEVGDVPDPGLQAGGEPRGRGAPAVHDGRNGRNEVELGRTARGEKQREREPVRLEKVCARRHRAVRLEDDAQGELPAVDGERAHVDGTLPRRPEVERVRIVAGRGGARSGDHRRVRERQLERAVRVADGGIVERVVEQGGGHGSVLLRGGWASRRANSAAGQSPTRGKGKPAGRNYAAAKDRSIDLKV